MLERKDYRKIPAPAVVPPPDQKPTNPKDAVGIAKAPFSCLPMGPIAEAALAMFEGARKYGRHNYRETGVRASVYFDALLRHVIAWWEGQDSDPDSGLPHVVKAIACLLVLRDAQLTGKYTDDRPPPYADNWLADLNAKAKALIEKYPDAKPAITRAETTTVYREDAKSPGFIGVAGGTRPGCQACDAGIPHTCAL